MISRHVVLLAFVCIGIGCNRESIPSTTTVPAAHSVVPFAPVASSPATVQIGPPPAPTANEPEYHAKLPTSWPHASPVAVHGKHGMVVTDSAQATSVGRDVLTAGGNAADAAVAIAFALAVVYPAAGNLGGGGFAVARMGSATWALDFRETAPAAAHRDMYLSKAGNPSSDSREGIRSVGVPGTVAGLWELHRVLGSKRVSWAELLAPAVRLAEQGFIVDEEFSRSLSHSAQRLKRFPTTRALFYPHGKAPTKGDRWKNPGLAAALARISERGRDGFYRGATAEAVAAQMKREHGWINQTDLDGYVAKWREPLEFTYRSVRVITMPPPSSGGATLAMIAHILEGFDLKRLGLQTPETLHVVLEAMRRAFAARNAKLGDPDFVRLPLDELLSAAWANEQRATIASDRATASSEIRSEAAASGNGSHTTHFSVADVQGNVVALTTTLNSWYGSGVVVNGAGFLLNNEMDDFAAVPGAANGFGLVQGEANAIAPGKRMLSSMTPCIVVGPDQDVALVAGAAGGPTIITAVFQELSNVLDFNLDPASAVGAPRFHMQHLPDVVTVEKGGITAHTRRRLETMGYRFTEQDHIADAPMIARVGGEWIGIAEPRRTGALAAAP